jgi:hypothetical protein
MRVRARPRDKDPEKTFTTLTTFTGLNKIAGF